MDSNLTDTSVQLLEIPAVLAYRVSLLGRMATLIACAVQLERVYGMVVGQLQCHRMIKSVLEGVPVGVAACSRTGLVTRLILAMLLTVLAERRVLVRLVRMAWIVQRI